MAPVRRPAAPARTPIGTMCPVPAAIRMIDPAAAHPDPGMIPGRRIRDVWPARVHEGRRSGSHDVTRRTTARCRCRTSDRARAGTDGATDQRAPARIVAHGCADTRAQNSADQCAGGGVVGLAHAIPRRPFRIGLGVSFVLLLRLVIVVTPLLAAWRRFGIRS